MCVESRSGSSVEADVPDEQRDGAGDRRRREDLVAGARQQPGQENRQGSLATTNSVLRASITAPLRSATAM